MSQTYFNVGDRVIVSRDMIAEMFVDNALPSKLGETGTIVNITEKYHSKVSEYEVKIDGDLSDDRYFFDSEELSKLDG